ncbi:MAG: rRNA maturation RNase YbeY, partial [Telluria sp.]
MAAKNKLSLSVQYPDPRLQDAVTRQKVRRWVQAALLGPAELTVRFVGADEGRVLNRDYRDKDYATNVLTFAYNEGEQIADDEPTRADIILCTDVLEKEAAEQKKTLEEHAA